VVVHAGEYREWVKPRHGGLSDSRRITYESAAGEHVVIKGSERVTDWEPVGGTVWKAVIDNSLFGSFNPFAQEVAGDWIAYQKGAPRKHLGDVYLNGVSFFEVASRAEVTDPQGRTEVVDNWTGVTNQIRDPEQTRLVWYAEVGAQTTIWANFQGADPNRELVEINVRRSVFYPEQPHLDYITVRGFELAHAASPWAPPTADQPGLIGPNWAKGWVIEDNVIHDAKCSAISIGKEGSTGHNYAVIFGGDDRYVGNLFVGGDPSTAYGPAAEGYGPTFGGTAGYDGHPASFEEYLARIDDQPPGDHHRFLAVKQPVYARANAYAAGARPFDGELEPRVLGAATATVVDEGDMVYLITELPDAFDRARIGVVTGRDLERVRCADADFEEADGAPAIMEIDLIGEVRQPGGQAAVGPIAALISGAGRTRIF